MLLGIASPDEFAGSFSMRKHLEKYNREAKKCQVLLFTFGDILA